MIIEKKKISDLIPAPYNPRQSTAKQEKHLKESLEKFGLVEPIIFNKQTGYIVGGHFRVRELKKLGIKEIECVIVDLNEADERELNIRLNANTGGWDWDTLANDWDVVDLEAWGLDIPQFDTVEEELEASEDEDNLLNNKKLSDRFIIPPFSVLDTKQGIWQDRKRYWINLGIESELGRNTESVGFSRSANEYLKWKGNKTGISIFDPVLCELVYQWFNIDKGKILDPFAGGSVRGIVAAKLGFEYLGNDLRKEQIEANNINAKNVLKDSEIYPIWTNGDSLNIDLIAKDYQCDLIFSCPPYAYLEKYSDLTEDISNMNYNDFLNTYNKIIYKSCEMLKMDRFAVFVVSDIRDKNGFYCNFISDTINCFKNCNLNLYNELILVNHIGTKAIGAQGYMKTRKIGKVHQNVLVFYKGDTKNIKNNYKELDLSYLLDNIELFDIELKTAE
jgi:DNA modification methylase